MNEQFIDRVINILVEMRLDEETPHKLKRARVAARRAEGIPPPMSRQERKTFKIATGEKKAPPSKITRAMNKTLGVDEARGDTILRKAGEDSEGNSEGINIPKRAKPVTDPKTGEKKPGSPRTTQGFRKKVARAQADRFIKGLVRSAK